MAQGDPRKWHMPGWRIEQKYSPGVLIGNWDEDRYAVRFLLKNCLVVDINQFNIDIDVNRSLNRIVLLVRTKITLYCFVSLKYICSALIVISNLNII